MSKEYTKDSIESLDAREHVRLRTGMYAGDTSTPNQLLLEVFSNALDEHNIGHGDYIKVEIKDDGTCIVEDQGQGFPINEVRPDDGKTILEASFSVINTSGKFSDEGVYGGSALGLNGVGAKVANFLSTYFEVSSWKNGKYEHLLFKDGLLSKRDIGDCLGKTKSGTRIEYKPDSQFFTSDKTSVKFFEDFFSDIVCLCPNLKIELNGNIIESEGIEKLIDRRLKNEIEVVNERMVINFQEQSKKLDLALSFCGAASPNLSVYVNYGLTTAGPHITSIKSTITRILNAWAKDNGLLKAKDKNLDGASLQEGMILACNIVTTGVAYDAQTKATITKLDGGFISTQLAKELELWLDTNPDDAKIIISKAVVARKATEAAKKAREAVKAKTATPVAAKTVKKIDLPSKLADCFSKNRKQCEIMIVEGDSAGGNLKDRRDNEFQAVLPVRGKVLNVQTATVSAIEKNAEIQDMISAFGLAKVSGQKRAVVDESKLRYGKIILLADADTDGSHIKNLLLTFIWTYAPELVKKGYVYAAIPPLYRLKNNKEVVYLKDDTALEEFKKSHDITKYQVSRNKG